MPTSEAPILHGLASRPLSSPSSIQVCMFNSNSNRSSNNSSHSSSNRNMASNRNI